MRFFRRHSIIKVNIAAGSAEDIPNGEEGVVYMKGTEGRGIGTIIAGLAAGFVIGIVAEGVAAFAGSIHGGAAGALRWVQLAGVVMAMVGVWLLLRRLGRRDAPVIYRPGRTPLEMEYEVCEENHRYEHQLAAADGQEHRMPRRGVDSVTVWICIGAVLAAVIPLCIALPG